jgi:hypothetical protein
MCGEGSAEGDAAREAKEGKNNEGKKLEKKK